MPRPGSSYQRGYGRRYQNARARILGPAGNGLLSADPPCEVRGPRCTVVATTADHDPPLVEGGFHLNLRPACKPCNFGHAGTVAATSAPPSRAW